MPENYRTVKAKFNIGDVVVRREIGTVGIITSIQISYHTAETYETGIILYGIRLGDEVDLYHEVELDIFVDPFPDEVKNEVEITPDSDEPF